MLVAPLVVASKWSAEADLVAISPVARERLAAAAARVESTIIAPALAEAPLAGSDQELQFALRLARESLGVAVAVGPEALRAGAAGLARACERLFVLEDQGTAEQRRAVRLVLWSLQEFAAVHEAMRQVLAEIPPDILSNFFAAAAEQFDREGIAIGSSDRRMLVWSLALIVALAALVDRGPDAGFAAWAGRARDAAVQVRAEMLLGEATWVRDLHALAARVRALTAWERWDDAEIDAEFSQWLAPGR